LYPLHRGLGKMRTLCLPLLLVVCVPSAFLQFPRGGINAQETRSSATYSDTLRMIKAWLQTEETRELGPLFSIGDERTTDLLTACHSEDEDVSGVAFLTLQLLGKSEGENCLEFLLQKHSSFAMFWMGELRDADFKRAEDWFAQKRTKTGYICGEGSELPKSPVDESFIYALILDGSPRAKLLLVEIRTFENSCIGDDNTVQELSQESDSLLEAAKSASHKLSFGTGNLESVVRDSAFFLTPDYRKESSVQVIAHNKAGDRILLEVSYHCGLKCGRGYYVVLRQDGSFWEYALIRMAWIS